MGFITESMTRPIRKEMTSDIKEKVRNITSIIIPCKNEVDGIAQIIEKVKQYGNEVIVVDGHSTDGTYEIAKGMGVKVIRDEGRGKGNGIRCGIEHVKNDIIVFIDADGSHGPEDIPQVVLPILENKSEMVIASRMYGGSDEYELTIDSFIRQVGSAFITLIINLRWKTNLSDVENGFSLFDVRFLFFMARNYNVSSEISSRVPAQ